MINELDNHKVDIIIEQHVIAEKYCGGSSDAFRLYWHRTGYQKCI